MHPPLRNGVGGGLAFPPSHRPCLGRNATDNFMTRIDATFAAADGRGRRLSWPIMAGDPGMASLQVVKGLPAAGVDVIELGAWPMAPTTSSLPAARRRYAAEDPRHGGRVRKGDDRTPIVMMGYYNPIYSRGVDRFLLPAPPGSYG